MQTQYAPAERENIEQVKSGFEAMRSHVPYDAILNLIPDISLILNAKRQVIFANQATFSTLGLTPADIIGARPGEMVGCVNSREPGGCGTAEACRVCGAVNAVLEALRTGQKSSKEARIATSADDKRGSLDLLVTAMPFASDQGQFLIVTLNDISDTKRRQVLERIFFHDLMNSLASLQAGMALLQGDYGSEAGQNDYLVHLASTTQNLIDEVSQQRELLTMEKGDLELQVCRVELSELAADSIRHVAITEAAQGKRLSLKGASPPLALHSDPVLLRRVILNMLKNALEASTEGDEIVLALAQGEAGMAITVSNPAVIPREHQLQIFQRSFSTKGRGRGIGTYSMRMLSEEYLGGKICFSSSEGEGTTFKLLLPIEVKARGS